MNFSPFLINVAVAKNYQWNVKMNVSKKESTIYQPNLKKHKRIKLLIFRITWKDFATFWLFVFNKAKYDNVLINSYLLLLAIEWGFEPIMIRKANQFVSFKFEDVQFLDIVNFLGAATRLDSFLKAYKTSETKKFFCMDGPIIQKSSTKFNFLLRKPSSTNCATKIPLKKALQTFNF